MTKPLFQLGQFDLHSGGSTYWRINAEGLSDFDLDTIAYIMSGHIGPFRAVEGVPTGGLRLAKAFEPYVFARTAPRIPQPPVLIVDDVLTTGASMEEQRAGREDVVGVVIFARSTPPDWIEAFMFCEDLRSDSDRAIAAERRCEEYAFREGLLANRIADLEKQLKEGGSNDQR